MAITKVDFPNNPVHGSTYTYLGIRYIFIKQDADAVPFAEGYWTTSTSGSYSAANVAEINAGTEGFKYISPLELSTSKYTREDESTGNTELKNSGVTKLNTTTAGIKVTGILNTTGNTILGGTLEVPNNQSIKGVYGGGSRTIARVESDGSLFIGGNAGFSIDALGNIVTQGSIGNANFTASRDLTVDRSLLVSGTDGIRVEGAGITYPGSTAAGGTDAHIGFRWVTPNLKATINNSTVITVGTASDYRIKDVITNDLGDALSMLRSLPTYKFYAKDDPDKIVYSGVIAHELQAILPTLVTGEKDNPKQLQTVDYAGLTPFLVQAVKQMAVRIEALEELNGVEPADYVVEDFVKVESPDFDWPEDDEDR